MLHLKCPKFRRGVCILLLEFFEWNILINSNLLNCLVFLLADYIQLFFWKCRLFESLLRFIWFEFDSLSINWLCQFWEHDPFSVDTVDKKTCRVAPGPCESSWSSLYKWILRKKRRIPSLCASGLNRGKKKVHRRSGAVWSSMWQAVSGTIWKISMKLYPSLLPISRKWGLRPQGRRDWENG